MFDISPAIFRAVAGVTLCAALPLAHAATPHPLDATTARAYNIPAGPLGAALSRATAGMGLALAFDPALTDGLTSPAVKGDLNPGQVLARLLAGSGLVLVKRTDGSLTLARPAASGPAPAPAAAAAAAGQTMPTIHVVGSMEPTLATGDAYTARRTAIGKTELSMREIPQSVSVVTRQRMDDQNITTLGDSVRYVTGMRSNPSGTGVDNLESRGYLIEHYLIDGLPSQGGQGMWSSTLLDLGIYDRVEIWRGPTALLDGAGSPSGTVNLARKRAQSDTAVQGAITFGSWNQKRVEADVGGPLNEAKTLRARVVAIHDDRDSFINAVWLRKSTVYGTVEYDFSPSTTLSLGATEQRGGSLVFVGLPLIAGGGAPDLPRSTYLGSTNGTKSDRAHRQFAELEHHLDGGGVFKLGAQNYLRSTELSRFMTNSFIDPLTREATLRGTRQHSREQDRGVDANLTLPFQLNGLPQQLLVGANYQTYKGGEAQGTFQTFKQNVDHPDLNLAIPEQVLPGTPNALVTQYGVYGQLRWKPWRPLTVLAGGRLAWWKTDDPDTPADNQAIQARLVPTFGVIGDVSDQLSLYASYNKIFSPQTERYATEALLAPRTGQQFEAGIKGEFLDSGVTSHLAVFRIDDRNRAVTDPENDDYSVAAGEVRSQGIEAEISGRLARGWDLTAGYAYTATKYVRAGDALEGLPFNSAFPRHNLSLWTKYRFDGALAPMSLGGGVRAVSKNSTGYDGVTWNQGAYAVWSLQGGYKINAHVDAMLTVNNLFDKHYFERLAGHRYRQTYYGEPLSVALAVRARF